MNFTVYDISLLVIFVIVTSIFLYKHRKNLKREGLLFLYKTKRGIQIIDRIGKKYKRTLNVLSYVSIGLGFILMAAMIYLFGKMVSMYIFNSSILQAIKVPPITPLIPYLPQLFKLDFLPPFYFISWIIIIAVVAISHEFFHGIFSVNKGVKIKSTGFGFFPFFLPIFLAFFVELDEKKMEKKKILPQMAVLSSGTFANIIITILFFAILFIFFSLSFAPSGVVFDTYTYSAVGIATITSINGYHISNANYDTIFSMVNGTPLSYMEAGNETYILTSSFLEQQKGAKEYLLAYNNAPAIVENISNIIVKIDGITVTSREQLGSELLKHKPGDKIVITTLEDDFNKDYELTLGENPTNKSLPYLGIGFLNSDSSGVIGNIVKAITSFKDSNVYYKPKFGAAEFIYDLLWWLVLISFSVALVNMLPVGIFDGGRFFYLALFGITKNKELSRKIFQIVTYIFLALLAVIMIFWGINFFR